MKIKNIVVVLVSLFTIGSLTAQITPTPIQKNEEIAPADKDGGPVMEFESMEVQYGVIDQHSDPLRKISFTNTGDEPLVIKNCKGSCGCTVPIWPKEPIMPGESADIEIRYATNRLGKINKTVKITTNEGSKPHVLKVLGEVLPSEDKESVPTTEPTMLGGGQGGK